MHQALIKYTVMRLAIFVVVLIVLDLFMDPSVVWIALGAGISLALSYLLLSRPREQLTEAIVERTEKRLNAKHEGLARSDAEIEDEADEAARARGEQS
ncbi:DUF4229 domain-containing protein [Kineosporia sp. NBRC 101731]|uniref:DUF4229 domain-containing protein n=1 Tax=Kineosporia sp. NBRC 101731 TaxID=3032199 RepID=UPI0024A5C208|nr:DUF4229 domain-containing protein [Kineosporia sp. NBRC 101731]GLY27599.1 hypothetical protein Kisp02_09640 [Kineosporia sp. NBRC 101731]